MKFPGLLARVGIHQINRLNAAGFCPCGLRISHITFAYADGCRELDLAHWDMTHVWKMPAGNVRNTRYTFAGTWGYKRNGKYGQIDKPWPPIVCDGTP